MGVLERVRLASGAGEADAERAAALREARENLKRDLIGALGLSTVAKMLAEDEGRARTELGVTLDALCNSGDYADVLLAEKSLVISQVIDEVCGLGPIQPLLDDPTITEVMINGTRALFYERDGELFQADIAFDSEEQILIVMDKILAPLGRRLDRSNPIVSARLPNGDRVNAVASPVAVDGTSVTIRKFSAQIRTLGSLVELAALPAWYAQLLGWAVKARASIAVCGGTGSGKTTLLNALSCEISHKERLVTVEDSAELRFDAHPNVVRLEAQEASIEGRGETTIRELVKNALRMRPDRIVVGECRGEEAIDMLQAMNSGHPGSLTTLHAGSAQESILRLVLMARFGMDLPADVIEEQIATAIDLVVMARRLADGSRVIADLTEVSRGDKGQVELRRIVCFDLARREWRVEGEPAFLARSVAEGVLNEREVEAWKSSCCWG